jgi:hypothetical protein
MLALDLLASQPLHEAFPVALRARGCSCHWNPTLCLSLMLPSDPEMTCSDASTSTSNGTEKNGASKFQDNPLIEPLVVTWLLAALVIKNPVAPRGLVLENNQQMMLN